MTTLGSATCTNSLASNGKILRRADVEHYMDAQQILRDAKAEAARMIQDAQDDIARQGREAYAEGLRKSSEEHAQIMVEAIAGRDRYLAKAEPELCHLLVAAVRRVFADFDAGEKAQIVVHKALSALRSQTQVMLRVHPSDYESVKGEVASLRLQFPQLEVLEVIPDNKVAVAACIMSSELGAVETSIDAQVDALAAAIARTTTPRPPEILRPNLGHATNFQINQTVVAD